MLRLRLVEGGRQRKLLIHIGCPPGIRTPICCSRGSCPTIERGGNAAKKNTGGAPNVPIVKVLTTPVNATIGSALRGGPSTPPTPNASLLITPTPSFRRWI